MIDELIRPGLAELETAAFSRRLREKDPSLWKADAGHQKIIRNSLGWLTVADAMAAGLGTLRSFVSEVKPLGYSRVVVLGMGGSSLACEVYARCLGGAAGWPALTILDTTNPGAVADLDRELDLPRTLFVVASKSGSTIEPNCLLAHYFAKAKPEQFIAITDPGTSLEAWARKARARRAFLNPSDIGGRFSALSLFGLVPAALSGIDVETLLSRARGFQGTEEALRLGAALGMGARAGRNKLTLSLSPRLASLGLWIEQLVAESTGKEGRGILPVAEPVLGPESYGSDRLFVSVSLKGETPGPDGPALARLEAAGQPVLRLSLADPLDLGAHFLLWEIATAAAGQLLGVNPFDQPDVQSAKDRTNQLLSRLEEGELPAEKAALRAGGLAAFCDPELAAALGPDVPLKDAFAAHFGRLGPRGYAAVLAYVNPNRANLETLEALRARLRRGRGNPVSVCLGPRYLHSTGQLFKGGAPEGVFLQLVESDSARLPVPGQRYTFGTLHRAQARGDFAATLDAGRKILRLELGPAGAESLRACANAVSEAQPCRA